MSDCRELLYMYISQRPIRRIEAMHLNFTFTRLADIFIDLV